MSSIRPLITITILVVVGVFLFTKINNGPAHLPGEPDATFDGAPAAEVPPLATTTDAAPSTPPSVWSGDVSAQAEGELTPQWAGNSSEAVAQVPPLQQPSATQSIEVTQDATISAAPTNLPAVPSIPELPPLPAAPADATASTTDSTIGEPISLPANIPTAQYPGEVSTGGSDIAAVPATPPAAMTAAPVPNVATETNEIAPLAEASSPVTPITPIAAEGDRYGAVASSATTEPSFAASWPEIEGALARQDLAQAHQMLSQWYGNPNLSPGEAQQVETLLGQLAGTVVYSTEHRLEPPYTVHAGDTLQTIAQQYEVPWQLLAKINGIPAPELVQPGQQLKVVHGPFSALVELGKSQMTLVLDGRYAGRFPITAEPGAAASEGDWVIEQTLVNPSAGPSGVISASYSTPSPVDRVLVLRSESPTSPGATISITGGPVSPSGPTAIAPAAIRLSPTDAEEVADILSVGSRVTIRK